jgi:hypothetical protein
MSLPPPAFLQSGASHSPAYGTSTPSGPRNYATASVVPVLVAGVALVAGSLCLVLGDSIGIGLAGYFTAGFATIICLGWDSVSQRKGLTNPNFTSKPHYRTFLRLIVGAGIVVAIVNLVRVALPIAEALSNQGGSQ